MSLNRKAIFGVGGVAIGAAAVVALVITPVVGADFSATGIGAVSGNAATLTIDLDDIGDSETFNLGYNNLAPGEPQTKTFTVTNSGSIPADASFKYMNQHWGTDPGDRSLLMVSTDDVGPVSLGGLNKSTLDLGVIEAGETIVVNLEVELDELAGNNWQGATFKGQGVVTLNQLD